ncbi:hypothetical protein WA026_001814 [Henosepilachna vigintioctopunctata]|uniref:Uncharacterized protein n=1 Tax=Henosepilachna vigintioctopunctata TaxID=420089 RepID=A0AAW1ULL2_9CUCU
MKISGLRKNKVSPYNTQLDSHQFYEPLLNYTDVEFDNEEINCLKLGYKHRPDLNNRKDKIRSLERLAAETDTIIQSVDNPGHIKSECERVIRNQFAFIKNNKNVGHFNKEIILSIKDKIKRNNLVSTKADEGNSVVILTKDNYNKKVLKFIVDNNFNKVNPKLSTFIEVVNDTLKKCSELISKTLFHQLSAYFTTIPRLYGLLKFHKSDIPDEMTIRPVMLIHPYLDLQVG